MVEFLGVHYGYIFGNYHYGESLGPKLFQIPLLIGVNWVVLTFVVGSMVAVIFKRSKLLSIFAGALLMVLVDVIIEPSAPVLDFWYWDNGEIPLKNYLGWFMVSAGTQTIYQYLVREKETKYSFHLLLCQIAFFSAFYLINVEL